MFFEFEKIVCLIYYNDIYNDVGGMMFIILVFNVFEVIFYYFFLDKIWYYWQRKGDDYKYVYYLSILGKLFMLEYYGW